MASISNLTARIGYTTRMEPSSGLDRIWISLRICPHGKTLATDRTSPDVGVEVCHLQNVVLSGERTNETNDNFS